MNTESLGKTTVGQFFIKMMANLLESRLRYRFFGPNKILEGAGIHPGMKVLEIGCGTGFFTLEAARMLGEHGSLIAMDVLPISVEAVARKVEESNLGSVVRVMQGDALDTKLVGSSLDEIILFGVIPAPMLPMEKLMAEMHRILRPDGLMAVWPSSWVHQEILRTNRFRFASKRNGVSNYQRISNDDEKRVIVA